MNTGEEIAVSKSRFSILRQLSPEVNIRAQPRINGSVTIILQQKKLYRVRFKYGKQQSSQAARSSSKFSGIT